MLTKNKVCVKFSLSKDFLCLILVFLIVPGSLGGTIQEKYLDEMLCSGEEQFTLDKQTTMILKLSRSAARLAGNYFVNFQCQFTILSSDYSNFMAVVQQINLRTNNYLLFETCKDYLHFKDKETYSSPICGRINARKVDENPSGLVGSRSFDANSGILVTVKFGGESDEKHNPFALEVTFTPNDYCTTVESLKPPWKQCSSMISYSKKCISEDFICDGIINCGFPSEFGLDESNCPKIKFKDQTNPYDGLRAPAYLKVARPSAHNVSKYFPRFTQVTSTTPSPPMVVTATKFPVAELKMWSTTTSQFLSKSEEPTGKANFTDKDLPIISISRKLFISSEDKNSATTPKRIKAFAKHEDDTISLASEPLQRPEAINVGKKEKQDDGIYIHIPVHLFCIVSSLVGILAILVFSTIPCCILCKFRKSETPQQHGFNSPPALLNLVKSRTMLPESYVVHAIPLRELTGNRNKNILQEYVPVVPAIAYNR